MDAASDAAELRQNLAAGITISAAFLSLYKFVRSDPVASFGCFPLTDARFKGSKFRSHSAKTKKEFRTRIHNNNMFSDWEVLLGITNALDAIQASGTISTEDSHALVLAILVIDDSYSGVHPGQVGDALDNLTFAKLRARLRLGQPLFSDNFYRTYPKPKRSTVARVRGQVFCDALKQLCVFKIDSDLELQYFLNLVPNAPNDDGFSRVGFVPTIAHSKELDWIEIGDARYTIREKAAATTVVRNRLSAAFDLLIEERAQLLILPELVSGEQTLQFIEEYFRTSGIPLKDRPVLILAGTQFCEVHGLRCNRATLINASGTYVAHQDKMHAYEFSGAEQTKAKNPLASSSVVDRFEDISLSNRVLSIIDISPGQRLVVLICEDLVQTSPHQSVIHELGVTTLLVPIMDGNRKLTGKKPVDNWVHDGAMAYIRHPGSSVFVANSGALVTTHRKKGFSYGQAFFSPQIDVKWQAIEKPGETFPLAWLVHPR